jgi:hypothetical protein
MEEKPPSPGNERPSEGSLEIRYNQMTGIHIRGTNSMLVAAESSGSFVG